MPKTTSEQTFENAIVADLVKLNQFHVAAPEEYDRELCLIPKALVRFLQVSQPKAWKELRSLLGDDEAETRILKRVRAVIEKKGTLYALRKGVDESGCHFELCFFPPTGAEDEELAKLHSANFFQVLRDEDPSGGFKYSLENGKSLDLGIFLNGLPIFTAEIKNLVSGQTVAHAIAQYQKDRDPKEPLFRFGRCLAHFAVDTEQVFMAATLDGKKTRFFPFNQGCDQGAGNPPSRTSIATAYLWREVWAKDSILDLIRRFIQVVDKLDDRGRPTGKKVQIFPRYHQLGCVREQTDHARDYGTGFSYLNQHSAGSGKTIEIATLANSLAILHTKDGKSVFNTVIVLSDRQVIDAQLQKELEQSEDADEETCEDKIREIMKRRGRMKHVSFFAFTATVKDEETGAEYTEAKMNGFSEDKLRLRFYRSKVK